MRLARKSALRVLDFDCECRPLSWYGGDWVSKEITAIAWGWVNPGNPARVKGPVECRLLGRDDLAVSLLDFASAYDEADVVTGHYIRGFDLPLLNGAALEAGLRPFGPKLSQDTKLDLIRFQGHSKSQENLGGLLGLRRPKIGMTQADWREASRLTPQGLKLAQRRAVGDVRQHVEMRAVLLERGMLGPPVTWTGGERAERYHP